MGIATENSEGTSVGTHPGRLRREALDRAIADAERHLRSLTDELEARVPPSEALAGARVDAERMASWLRAKIHDLRRAREALDRDANGTPLAVRQVPLSATEGAPGLRRALTWLFERLRFSSLVRSAQGGARAPP